jgi:hypothetical protein
MKRFFVFAEKLNCWRDYELLHDRSTSGETNNLYRVEQPLERLTTSREINNF